MTKRKTLPISQTIAALANRLPIGPLLAPRKSPPTEQPPELFFDELTPTPDQVIKWLEGLGWWGYLEKGEPGETRGIEVRRG